MVARMVRKKREELPSWEDKINRAMTLEGRSDYVIHDENFKYTIIEWHCTINMFGNQVPKTYTSIKAILIKDIIRKRRISISPGGYFCECCLTNEYLKSQNELMPGHLKRSDAGVYCMCCGAV